MIVGCYDLRVTCLDASHKKWERPEAEFTHEFGSTARRMAREAGWTLNMRTHEALCPKCSQRAAAPK